MHRYSMAFTGIPCNSDVFEQFITKICATVELGKFLVDILSITYFRFIVAD
jgi:hypothetical protein